MNKKIFSLARALLKNNRIGHYSSLTALGVLLSAPALADRAESYTYNSQGLIETVDGPRTDVQDITRYTYTSQGQLSKITSPLGHTTQLSGYNGMGKPTVMVDANGTRTELAYHSRGWLEKVTVVHPSGDASKNAVTTMEHDAVGQVTSITTPDGQTLHYEYDDARRLTAISNSTGRIEYTLDNASNITQEQVLDAQNRVKYQLTKVYDELSRVMDVVSANEQTTHYGYTVNNEVANEKNPRGHQDNYQYDALGRLIRMNQPIGSVQYAYNSQDQLTQVTDGRGLKTTYDYNGYGDLISMTSPDTGTTTYTYDAAGNRISETNAEGETTLYRYDAENRLIKIQRNGATGENIYYFYDDNSKNSAGIGRLTRVKDESSDTRFRYNHFGQVTYKYVYPVNAASFSETQRTRYMYNDAGQLIRMDYPTGLVVRYQRWSSGEVKGMTVQAPGKTAQTVLSNVRRLPFGPVTRMTYGNGVEQTGSYDQDYRLKSLSAQGDHTVQDLNYRYDANNNIIDITNSSDAVLQQLFGYDALDRITQAKSPDTAYGQYNYTYDAVGNRLTRNHKQSGTTTQEKYSYSTSSNQLDVINQGSQQRSFTYDANGNLIEDQNALAATPRTASITYDRSERPIEWNDGNTQVNYLHNAFGQRTEKHSSTNAGESSEHYHYDLNGQLIAVEKSTSNSSTRTDEIIYLNNLPVALVRTENSQTNVYYILNDHLATPQLLMDQQQTVVWQVTSQTPFGELTVDQDPDKNGKKMDFALRFPGQYWDEETQTSYNYFRNYDPSLGRYVESDPIGLAGGVNTYGYVYQNPLYYVDSDGLNPAAIYRAWQIGNGIGRGFNKGFEFANGGIPFGVQLYDWTHPNQPGDMLNEEGEGEGCDDNKIDADDLMNPPNPYLDYGTTTLQPEPPIPEPPTPREKCFNEVHLRYAACLIVSPSKGKCLAQKLSGLALCSARNWADDFSGD